MNLSELLARFPRVAIAGVPRSGKTTGIAFTAEVDDDGRRIIHTDDWKQPRCNWADAPALVIAACQDSRFLVEGVQVGRCLRKGLVVDAVVWMAEPLVELDKGQATMAKGCKTIFDDWLANGASRADGGPVTATVFDGRFLDGVPVFEER